jgi:hypothetical protein
LLLKQTIRAENQATGQKVGIVLNLVFTTNKDKHRQKGYIYTGNRGIFSCSLSSVSSKTREATGGGNNLF